MCHVHSTYKYSIPRCRVPFALRERPTSSFFPTKFLKETGGNQSWIARNRLPTLLITLLIVSRQGSLRPHTRPWDARPVTRADGRHGRNETRGDSTRLDPLRRCNVIRPTGVRERIRWLRRRRWRTALCPTTGHLAARMMMHRRAVQGISYVSVRSLPVYAFPVTKRGALYLVYLAHVIYACEPRVPPRATHPATCR